MRRRLYRAAAVVAAACCAFTACGPVAKRKALKDCKFDLRDVEVQDISLTDVTLKADVAVLNPNATEVIVDRFSYKLWSDKNLLADGWHNEKDTIAPGQEKVLSVSMNSPLKNLGKGVLNQLRNRGGVTYTLQATVYLKTFIGDLEVPVTVRKKY